MSQTPTHERQSYRLKHHNYAETRAYHITACSFHRQLIFSEIVDACIHLFPIGRIIDEEIRKTPLMRPNVILDTYVVMPNHVHIILILTEAEEDAPVPRQFEAPKPGTLSSILNGLKSACTSRVRKELGPSDAKVWQGRFYDRVIRDEDELNRTRQYIHDNPAQWQDDHENPINYRKLRHP